MILTDTLNYTAIYTVEYTVNYAVHSPPSRTAARVLPSECSRPIVPHALPIVCRMKYMSAGPGSRPPAAAAHITGMASAHHAACFLKVMQHITSRFAVQ